ncbi:hypothetical protein ACN28S_22535 [Cystobacter fuscus]
MRVRKVRGLLASGVIAAVALSVTPPAAYAATAVNEDFEDGVANGFIVATGEYSIVTDGTKVYKTASATARAVVGDRQARTPRFKRR